VVGHDDVLLLGERRRLWITRLDDEWIDVDAAALAKARRVAWHPARRIAVVTTAAQAACQVWTLRGERLIELARFRERVREIRIRGDAVFALWPEQQQAFELVGPGEEARDDSP
jgi:hypothetical protein